MDLRSLNGILFYYTLKSCFVVKLVKGYGFK